MAPFQGSGAGQAFEDADGFRLLLESGVTRADIPRILETWERVCILRAPRVQQSTRAASEELNEERLWKNLRYNWTYHGIYDALDKLNRGEEV
jgi:2-polyprenyl-6-methoxyphenol hydroxylase-like FAD-dependent oxidoreductase